MASLFESLTGASALRLDLGARGTLRLCGADRGRFLNAMISNDVAETESGASCVALLLNRKGHILSELRVLVLDEALLLDTAPGTGVVVRETLERHVVADDVMLEDLSEAWGHVGLEGPGVRELLAGKGQSPPPLDRVERASAAGETLIWLGGGALTPEGVQVWGPRAALARLVSELALAELSETHAEVLRIEAFLPRYGVDMTDRNFPQEARLETAVSFSKGCYLGQEIVARIDSRGAVKRLLCQIRSEAPLSRGDPIRVGDQLVGEITSAACSEVSGPVALGYVRAAQADPGTKLDVGGVTALIAAPAASAD